MPLNPNDTLLNGQYRILRLLGRGGFGFVYQAWDTLLHDDVAIKELIPALVRDDVMLKRFLAEARATMRLAHEHIVRTHNVFQQGGNYYIVMECMSGGSLEDRLREKGSLPIDEAVCIAAEVCDGLAYAHARGIVHCDLKQANILFAADGAAKVADFGIAHVSGEMLTRSWMTPAGFVAGTLPYMSPEQADGVRDDPRVDVYALGAVLYRMLTGRTYLDFDERETPGAQADNVLRIRSQEPAAPSMYNRRVPGWLDDVVLRALAKDPERRCAGTSEMRDALERRGVAAPALLPAKGQAKLTGSPDRRAARHPVPLWGMIGGAAVLLVAIFVGAVMLFGGRDGPKEPPTPEATEVAVATATSTVAPTHTSLPPTSMSIPSDTPRPMDALSPTGTPSLTASAAPSATAPATHNPTETATSGTTPEPTSTHTTRPTDTQVPLTSTPRPTNTSAPPTRAPSRAYAAPVLLSPQSWEAIGDKFAYVVLEWESIGDLGPDDYYLVEMSCDFTLPGYGTQVSFLTKDTTLPCDGGGGQMYACWSGNAYGARYGYASHWKVTVVRAQQGQAVEPLSPPSETISFVWRTP